jgi:hypothetical protein
MTVSSDLQRRLLFILHRGLIETRLLAQAGKQQQVFDLADALEPLPGWMASWTEEHLNDLRTNLEAYARKYPDAFNYLDFLDKYELPDF